MTSVSDVCARLDEIAPTKFAQSWDNVGLLAGDLAAPVRRVLLCIDLMPAVVDEAIRRKIDFVLAYHPPIFKPVTRLVTPSSNMESGVVRCIANGIAVYATHTAFDAARGGSNDTLAALCGADKTEALVERDDPDDGGIGRIGVLPKPTTLLKLARRLKRVAPAGCLSLVGKPEAPIKRVIVVVGAAGSLPFGTALGRRDAIVTGEIRHHDALTIDRMGTNAIAMSHWSSERPGLATLARALTAHFPGLKAELSRRDVEPFTRV